MCRTSNNRPLCYPLLRRILFQLPPERAHDLAIAALHAAGRMRAARYLLQTILGPKLTRPVEAFGLTFPNPIGLAAGFDKNGLAWPALGCLGFGHIEVGTVTPRPQVGNPRPRLFRILSDHALINRMGFPNRGADFVADQLTGPRPPGLILGVNIGKQKETPIEQAVGDYCHLLERLGSRSDYVCINVSSPNTPGLRRLQARKHLEDILTELVSLRAASPKLNIRHLPLLVKLSPDLDDAELDQALEAIVSVGIDGIIATNTTTHRPRLHSRHARETGGLSGPPLEHRSTAMIRTIHRRTSGSIPIIGAGGISTPDGVQAKLDAGAVLVQIYTAFIFRGPSIVKALLQTGTH